MGDKFRKTNMTSSNHYLSPTPDALAKPLGGIDLNLEQSKSVDESHAERFQRFQPQRSKFAPTGLWRKKRDIASIKINHAR